MRPPFAGPWTLCWARALSLRLPTNRPGAAMETLLTLLTLVVVLAGAVRCLRIASFTPRAGAPGVVEACGQCRYSLVGLPGDARCPECGCERPRFVPGPRRFSISFHPGPGAGISVMGAAYLGIALFYKSTWDTFHHEPNRSCPIDYWRLEPDPSLASLGAFLVCSLLYLASQRMTPRTWFASACVMGIGLGIGSHIGLSMAATNHHDWHRVLVGPMTLGGLACAVLGEALLVTGHHVRSRRPAMLNAT